MVYKIGQVTGTTSAEIPNTETPDKLIIVQLGIQAPKGATITLSNIADNSITMGELGIFEIPQSLDITVSKVKVELPEGALSTDKNIIIDYLYEDNGGGTEV